MPLSLKEKKNGQISMLRYILQTPIAKQVDRAQSSIK